MTIPAIPLSTYRLQLTPDFGFDDAAKQVPYLKALGISHLYVSPILKARAASKHGYDIVDHQTLNPEYGGEEGFLRLSDSLKQVDMGLIVDFVPNHMGVGFADNAWWLDVLEWGPESPHAVSFDIAWDAMPYRRSLGILLPILGRPYGDVLTAGEIELKYNADEGTFSAWYFDHRIPINPRRYSEILSTIVHAADASSDTVGCELVAIARRYTGPKKPSWDEAPELKGALAALPDAPAVIDRGLAAYRADSPAGLASLHSMLQRQHYRLAYWRVAVSSINYRRFFDISDLAGLRIEDPHTFREVHSYMAALIAQDRVQGLRIDHIDGLWDPAQYTRRLHHLLRVARKSRRPFFVVVEKILADRESMPQFTRVAGTTGYEALNAISRLLVDSEGLPSLDAGWRKLTGNNLSFKDILENSKRQVLDTLLASEFSVLCQLLARIGSGHYSTRDYTIDRLRAALELFVIEFPVYRTYLTVSRQAADERATINHAIQAARARWRGSDPQIFDFIREALTLDLIKASTHSRVRLRHFAIKMQQFTGPVMAKSLEDTAGYRYHRLLALNEVGGSPDASALSPEMFHTLMAERAAQQPHGLTATATHDTKRGEDARCRLFVLSEMPDEWLAAVAQWRTHNAHLVQTFAGGCVPSLDHEYMLYQSLMGAWPIGGPDESFTERMTEYALKAARESKQETSWDNQDQAYEAGLRRFVMGMLDPRQSASFIESFNLLAQRVALLGALNSLVQLVIKATIPGVPDFYQGTEFWDLALVDPDNRCAVDFLARDNLLRVLSSNWPGLVASWPDAQVKMALTKKLLALRQQVPQVFQGDYRPIEVEGPDCDHVVAFARSAGHATVVVAVARHLFAKTNGGRVWPCDWSVSLKGFSSEKFVDVLSSKVSGDRLFDALPVRIWRIK